MLGRPLTMSIKETQCYGLNLVPPKIHVLQTCPCSLNRINLSSELTGGVLATEKILASLEMFEKFGNWAFRN